MASNFSGNLSLVWINQINRIDQSETSSLGLKKTRFIWNWSNGKKSGLTLVFRPEAFSQSSGDGSIKMRRERDDRLGDVVDETPSLNFLDAYQIQLTPLNALRVSLGVFEQLSSVAEAYSSDLPFGLEIRPVSKTFALLFSWVPEGGRSPVFDFDIAIFQGTNERSEQGTSQDVSPKKTAVGNDDHKNGGLLATRFQLKDDMAILATLSYHEARLNELFDVSRAYLQGGFTKKLGIKSHSLNNSQLLLCVDAKYAVDKFDRKSGSAAISNQTSGESVTIADPIPDRTHQSLKFSGVFEMVPEFFILGSLDFGKAMLDPARIGQTLPPDDEVKAEGYQYEFGVKASSKQGASAQLAFATEVRQSEDQLGNRAGGFNNGDNSYRNSVQRLALNISYIFDSRL